MKQMLAYEMRRGLVGSERCIIDRDNHHHVVALSAKGGNLFCHELNALNITDRGATKFLNDETHSFSRSSLRH